MKQAIELPSALDEFPIERYKNTLLVIFLDFDGTLTPIISQPQEAQLSDMMRQLIRSLASKYPVAIISGRALEDVKKRVALDELYYAGSHGFEISGPGGLKKELEEAKKLVPVIEKVKKELEGGLSSFEGVYIETKPYSLAIHYRNVSEKKKGELIHSVYDICQKYDQLILKKGKEVINLDPDLNWDKGKAVVWLLKHINIKKPVFSIYLGDDTTDEDAFKALKDNGIGILVRDKNHDTYAEYALNNPEEVRLFLQKLEHC